MVHRVLVTFVLISASESVFGGLERLAFRNKPSDTRLAAGSDSTVVCSAEGPGTVIPLWRRVGHVSLPSHVRDVGGELQFSGVRSTDAGSYICTVASADGQQSIDVTIRIDVIGKRLCRQTRQYVIIKLHVVNDGLRP
jgi:Immunoglobulin domain